MRFSKYFLILLLYFNVIDPSISLLQMKDLYSVLKVEKNFFSPIYGLILSETSYLKNLYEFGDETSPIVQLVKELFFIHHDQVTFDRTYNPFKPAAFFTPEIIGQLVGHIENYKQDSSEENKEAIKQVINSLVFEGINTEDIDSDMYKNIKIKHSAYNEIDKFTKNIIGRLEKEEEALGSSIGRLEEKLKTGLQGTKQEKQQQREKINKEIRVLEPKLQSAREKLETQRKILSNHEKIKKYLLDNINQLIDSIISSIEQENITVFENHTIFLFLTFLWEIASTKEDFVKYFESLRNTLQEKSIFKNPDFLAKGKEVFLNSNYTKKDYSSLIEKSYQLNFDNFEELIFLALGLNLYENPFPKHINMKGKVNYKGEIFPDCGETALLNFFNVLLFDPESRNFNIDILKKLGAKQSIINFYEKYKNNSLADTLELHNDWAKVVSGLPNIVYKQGTYEIRAGLEENRGLNNFLNVIKNLIFPDKEIPTELVLGAFNIELEKNNYPVKIHEITIENKPDSTLVYINLINKFNDLIQLRLKILNNHFILSCLIKQDKKDQLITIINNNLTQINNFTMQFMMLASLNALQFNSFDFIQNLWIHVKYLYPSILNYYELFLLFSPTFTDKFTSQLTINISNNKCLKYINNKYKQDLIKKLYLSLPEDEFIQIFFWNQLLSYDVSQQNLNSILTLKKSSDFQKFALMKAILQHNKKDFFYIVKNIFNQLSENKKITVAGLILKFNNEDAIKYFQQLIKNYSISIKNKSHIARMINYILSNNREEFFPYVHNIIEKIKKVEDKNKIVLQILKGDIKTMHQFYPFAKNYLFTIKDSKYLSSCLVNILESDEKIKEFKTVLRETINKIQPNDYFNIIYLILKADPIIMKEIEAYKWALKNINFITNPSYKIDLLLNILINDPQTMKEEGFYNWAINNINSITNLNDKLEIAYRILKSNSPDIKEAGFYDWLQENKDSFPSEITNYINHFLSQNI